MNAGPDRSQDQSQAGTFESARGALRKWQQMQHSGPPVAPLLRRIRAAVSQKPVGFRTNIWSAQLPIPLSLQRDEGIDRSDDTTPPHVGRGAGGSELEHRTALKQGPNQGPTQPRRPPLRVHPRRSMTL